jgi:hypothetical protein
MGCLPADHDAQADHRVDGAVHGQLLGGHGNLEGAGHPGDHQVGVARTVSDQRVDGALEEPLGHDVVETADHDAETHSSGIELAGLHVHGRIVPDISRTWRGYPASSCSASRRWPSLVRLASR